MRKIFTFIVCILLLQTNSNAQSILWQKNLGCSNDDGANSEQQTFDGGYIIAGSTKSNDSDVTNNHGGEDFWIVKLNSSRNIGWQKTLGGSGADYEIVYNKQMIIIIL
jgi:hypothetical protein